MNFYRRCWYDYLTMILGLVVWAWFDVDAIDPSSGVLMLMLIFDFLYIRWSIKVINTEIDRFNHFFYLFCPCNAWEIWQEFCIWIIQVLFNKPNHHFLYKNKRDGCNNSWSTFVVNQVPNAWYLTLNNGNCEFGKNMYRLLKTYQIM
jgi:hypothetical protein